MLGDAIDLYRFRVKSLLDYRYPWWQVALLITLFGLVISGGSPELGGYLPGRVGFSIGYNWFETLLFVPFIGVWLGVNPWRFCRPLLAISALGSSVQLLQPLLSWLPDDVANGLLMVSMVYSLLVLSHALARVSGKGRLRAMLGVLLFSLCSTFLMQGAWYLSSRQGWVAPPASAWNPFAGDDGSSSSSDDNGASSSDSGNTDQSASDGALAVMP
jgi:F0F1-type ATP synthase assembly protein I